MKRALISVLLIGVCLSIMAPAAVAADKNKIVITNLAGDTVTSFFNPEELGVKKGLPWKTPTKVGSTTPTIGCDYATVSAVPRPGLIILSPNPQTIGPLGPNATATIDWEMIVDADAVDYVDFAVEVGWGGGETSSAVMRTGIKVEDAAYMIDIMGSAGGTVATGDLAIDLPPGSFDGLYTFTAFEETPPLDPAPAGLTAKSNIYYVSPAGLEFTPGKEPIVAIKYDPAADTESLDIYSYDPDTGWQKETLNKTFDLGANELSVEVQHFSYFAVFGPPPATGLNNIYIVALALVSLSLGLLSLQPLRRAFHS